MIARLATPADDALLTSIVLHPDVHRSNGGGEFDPSNYTAHPTNFAVVVEGGCFTADALERDAYLIHTNFLPEARGAQATECSKAALAYAFTQTSAEQLYTVVHSANPHVLRFAHSMGFKNLYSHGDVMFLRLQIDDWIRLDSTCWKAGIAFHDRIEPSHEQDSAHDAYVGAAILMIQAVKFEKAERIYGRWARMAGYQPFAFIGTDPVRIDIGSHVLRLDGQDFIIEDK